MVTMYMLVMQITEGNQNVFDYKASSHVIFSGFYLNSFVCLWLCSLSVRLFVVVTAKLY